MGEKADRLDIYEEPSNNNGTLAPSSSALPEKTSSSSSSDRVPTFYNYYYYQNPTTGSVSNNALSLEQIIKLLVPVREGMHPILTSQTQCLPVDENNQNLTEDWRLVSTVNVLKEAACSQWYYTTGDRNTHGPATCRSLLEAYHHYLQNIKEDSSSSEQSLKFMVYAPDITKEWKSIDSLPDLKQVLDVLQSQPPPPPPAAAEEDAGMKEEDDVLNRQEVQDELEAFLSSTAASMGAKNHDNDDDDDDDQAYESDGGTRYVKEPLTGRWIHEALAPPPREEPAHHQQVQSQSQSQPYKKALDKTKAGKKSESKKPKFTKRNARNWIYVTGLPPKVEEAQVQKFFGKVGMLDLDPETMHPKIKLYKNEDGTLKGDASLCYARPESVELALQVLDESPWDEHYTIRVERAKFEAKRATNPAMAGNRKRDRRNQISQAQRKVARLALLQAQDEGFGDRLAGGRKGLRIVVVKHMLDGIAEKDWESKIQGFCQELDNVALEKITCISKTKVVIIKFVEPTAASEAVDKWNGKLNPATQKPMEALYWDGVTDYTNSHEDDDQEDEERRHDEFGNWLDNQGEEELPPELRLQVAEE